MKYQVTQKSITESHYAVIRVEFCKLQHLLAFQNAAVYTAGRYGWKSDVYTLGNIAISTGAQPFGKIKATPEICSKWDHQAQLILSSNDPENIKRHKINILLNGFIDEIMRGEKKRKKNSPS